MVCALGPCYYQTYYAFLSLVSSIWEAYSHNHSHQNIAILISKVTMIRIDDKSTIFSAKCSLLLIIL